MGNTPLRFYEGDPMSKPPDWVDEVRCVDCGEYIGFQPPEQAVQRWRCVEHADPEGDLYFHDSPQPIGGDGIKG